MRGPMRIWPHICESRVSMTKTRSWASRCMRSLCGIYPFREREKETWPMHVGALMRLVASARDSSASQMRDLFGRSANKIMRDREERGAERNSHYQLRNFIGILRGAAIFREDSVKYLRIQLSSLIFLQNTLGKNKPCHDRFSKGSRRLIQ